MKYCLRKGTLNAARRSLACLALTSALFVLAGGCGKKAAPVAPAGEETNQVAVPPPKPESPAQAGQLPPVVQANGEPDLAEMNRYLLRWIMRNQRRPNSFEDFAATAGVTIPPPPAGKKYVIGKDMHIQLVNK